MCKGPEVGKHRAMGEEKKSRGGHSVTVVRDEKREGSWASLCRALQAKQRN